MLFGEEIHVNAEIYNLEGFSGHADRDGLLSWLSGFRQRPSEIFLVHGEMESKKEFAKTIKKELGYDATVVEGFSEYELVNHKIVDKRDIMEEVSSELNVFDIRKRIAHVHDDLEKILYNTQLAVGGDITCERAAEIKNIVLELEKMSLNLGSAVTLEEQEKH